MQRANAFKNEILGTVAHDLKNPLSVILGRTEMLSDMLQHAVSPVDSMRQQIGHIRTATKRLTEMVDTLVADAMADALDITVRRELIDLASLVNEVAEANRPLAERKQQIISVSVPAEHPALVDSDRMRETIDNLLSNAVKYSPIGGRIDVEIARDGSSTVIRVKDEGAGLSPEDLTRLFGRFQRLSAKPTGGENSTGLGLSIVKRIIDLHGGTIAAESPGPGLGTTFTVTLPPP